MHSGIDIWPNLLFRINMIGFTSWSCSWKLATIYSLRAGRNIACAWAITATCFSEYISNKSEVCDQLCFLGVFLLARAELGLYINPRAAPEVIHLHLVCIGVTSRYCDVLNGLECSRRGHWLSLIKLIPSSINHISGRGRTLPLTENTLRYMSLSAFVCSSTSIHKHPLLFS
jgi:hypothetical protein